MKALWKCTKCDYSESIDCGHDAGRCVHTHLSSLKAPGTVFGEPASEFKLAVQEQHDMKVEKEYSDTEWKIFCKPKK